MVARVDGLARDDLRSLGVAVRDQPERPRRRARSARPRAAASPSWRPPPRTAGSTPASLIADAARTVGGGGGKNPELAVAGGKDASKIDEALDQARAAAGIA